MNKPQITKWFEMWFYRYVFSPGITGQHERRMMERAYRAGFERGRKFGMEK